MNFRDSEAIISLLRKAGHTETKDIEEASIAILNTCSVRDSAERKVEGYLWKLRSWKEENTNRILCIVGCMAQSEGDKLLAKFPHLDIVLGTSAISKLPELIKNASCDFRRVSNTQMSHTPYDDCQTHLSENKFSAYIPVMRGCSMRCSYCIVPQVRGEEYSRSANEIVEEAKTLAENGVVEIFLLGQNVAAYGLHGKKSSDSPFADLLAKIANIDKVKRIRFTSPHPANFNDKLIETVCEIRKICSSIHLPLQSGSDKILTLMRRNYTATDYMRIIEKLKSGRPELSFSTDVIVGFPSEDEEDFNATRKILNDVDFDQEFIFKYSKRKNTPASIMDEQIPAKIKEERNQILLRDLRERVLKKNKNMLGAEIEILIEAESPRQNNRLIGRSSSNKTVVVEKKNNVKLGDFAIAIIEDFTLSTLYGKLK